MEGWTGGWTEVKQYTPPPGGGGGGINTLGERGYKKVLHFLIKTIHIN
jgi:hypothetical protein